MTAREPGRTVSSSVCVEAPARLHLGVLDLRGETGRWFGGIGVPAPGPTLLVEADAGGPLEVDGEDAARAARYAERFLRYYDLPHSGRLRVRRSLPAHVGLGSGTQLALAVGKALAELHGVESDVADLAHAVGRGRRSAVGSWIFDGGGLVVEGGRPLEGERVAPLLSRLPLPRTWWGVVAVPGGSTARMAGETEERAFAQLPAPPEDEVNRVAHLVLMGLLPAVADGDLDGFGRALTEIQRTTGRWFASVQGSAFAAGPSADLVRRMAGWGAHGVGQSSWGPAVYGIVEGPRAARALGERVREALDELQVGGRVFEGSFPPSGARVWPPADDAVLPSLTGREARG